MPSRLESAEAHAVVAALFEGRYTVLVKYAQRHCHQLALAEEAVQAAMMALYCQLVEHGAVDNPSAWVFCVLRRELIRMHRVAAREDRALRSWLEATPAAVSGVGEDTLADGRDEDLDVFLSALTGRERDVLLLRAQAMKYHEIAAALEISVNTVKTLLARALRKVRDAARMDGEASIGIARRDGADEQTLQ